MIKIYRYRINCIESRVFSIPGNNELPNYLHLAAFGNFLLLTPLLLRLEEELKRRFWQDRCEPSWNCQMRWCGCLWAVPIWAGKSTTLRFVKLNANRLQVAPEPATQP